MAENYFDRFDQQPKSGNYFDEFDEKPEPAKRGALAVANDTAIEAANAVAGGVSAAANFVKPGNSVSKFIDDKIIKAGEESQSDVVKASKKKFRDDVEGADGVGDELKAVGGYVLENPLLSAAQAAGSFVGPGAAIKGAGAAARAAGAGAKAVERAGLAGGAAAGAAMAGGDAAGTAYDLASKAGATDDQATAAGRQASVIPAVVGAAGSLVGAERLVAGAKGFGGNALARAGKTAAVEAAQEGFEEGITQYEGQRAAVPFDPTIDPTKGVAAAAGMGAALGGITGGGVSLLTGGHGGAAPAPAAAPLLLTNEPDPLVAFPDGTVGRQTEIDAYLASLPEDQRAAERARMMGLGPEAVAPAPAPATAGAEDARRSAITRMNELNQQERGEPAVAQVAPPDGAALLAQQRAAEEAARQADLDASRAVTGPDDEILQSIGAVDAAPTLPSQRMGLDLAAGPLSSAAVVAVDSGASRQLADQAALQQAAEVAKEQGDAEQVGLDFSAERPGREQLVEAHAADLRERLDFLQQQGRAGGWDARLIAERDRVQSELDALAPAVAAPAPAPTTVKEGVEQARARRGASKGAASAPAAAPAQGAAVPSDAVAARPSAWRTNALQARKVAKSLGIDAGGLRTPQIVAAIDARDAQVQTEPQGGEDVAAARGVRMADDGVQRTADAAPRAGDQPQRDAEPAGGAGQRGGDSARAAPAVPEAVPDAARAGERQPALSEEAAPAAAVDAAAHEAATSPLNDTPEPTQAQKEAGNYKLGHLSGADVQGLRLSIENPQGSTRSGTSPDGTEWSNTMAAHYGYVKGTEAADGDHVDVFVGPHAATAPTVYVVDQVNADGSYDEAKALFGFNTEAEAVAAYRGSYDANWKVGPITAMSVDEFKAGLAAARFMKPLDSSLADVPFRRMTDADGTQGLSPAVANAMRALSRPSYSPEARMQAVTGVQKTVDAIRAAWGNGPDVVVAFDMGDPVVPAAARRADLKQRSGGARGAPEGFYYRGKAYLMASRLSSAQDAARVLYHEVLGHHGLRGRFGKQLDGVLNQIATTRRAEVDAKIKEYGLRGVNKLDRRAAAEEVLAEMAQRTPELHFVRRAVAAIRAWLREHVPGFRGLRLTDDEIIRNFILPARQFVERGAGAAAPDPGPSFSRAEDAAAPQRQASNFAEAREAAKAFQGTPLLNIETGMKAVVSRNSLDKMLSAKSVSKSETPATHAMAVANVDALFREAILGWSKPDRGNDPNIRAIHRFFAPMEVDGRLKLVKLTVKENAKVEGTNPLYTVEAVELNDSVPGRQWVEAAAREDGLTLDEKNPLQREWADEIASDAGPRSALAQPRGVNPGRSAEDVISLAEQIERGNAAGGEAGDTDIMFSRSKVAGYARTATAELNKTFSAPGTLSWWHKTVGTMYHLAERSPAFKPVFEAAQAFVDDVSFFANDAAELAPKLLPKLETWRDTLKSPVAAADNKAVAKPVFEGTLTWARDEQRRAVPVQSLIDAAAGLTAEQKAQRLLRNGHLDERMLKAWQGMPLESYEKAVGTRFESRMLQAGVVWSDAELRSMFNLNDGQVELYREFREATDRSLDTMARADMLRYAGDDAKGLRGMVMDAPDAQSAAVLIRDHLVQLAGDQPDRATLLLNTANGVIDRADKVRDLQARGYAPLSRFGRFTVDAVDAAGERQYFGLFETAREANTMAARMREEFGEAGVSQGTLSEEAFKMFAGVTPETLELFGNALGLDSTGDSAQDKAFQDYLRLTKTNRSAMRRLIHRKGIAGFSEDVGRVLATFVYSNARQTAAGLHMGDLGEAVTAIPKAQGELKDAAVRLAEYVKNPQEEAQAVRGLLFAQYLGGSIASALVNALQPVQVTFPWLSQYGGAKAAAAQIGRAAKDLAARGKNYEPDLAAALKRAEAEGVVAPQEVHQLMAQARGAGSLRSGDGTRGGDLRALGQNALSRVSLAWGKVFGAAEQLNRRITFIAAYRTAKAQGIADPAGFARQAITETQFLYSKANKMEWGRGAVGGTLMTFKTYSIAYLELLNRMYTQGGPEGKRAALLALGMLMLMGGAGGLPFAEDLEDAADGLAQMMGYNFSAKKARQEFLESMLPRGIAQFIDKGVSGLPGAPLDVSGRLGMGNLIPGTGLLLEKTRHARDVLEIAGPAGDFASRILSGGRSVLTGDVGAGVLEMSPAAVRNAAKGADMAATGMYRDAKGYKVLDTNALEAAMKAIGFQPGSVATIQEANRISQGAKAFYNLRAQEIRALWAQGIFEGDPKKAQAARDQVAAWNEKNPEQPMQVRIPDVMRRVREMRKSKDERIADTAPRAMRAQLREDAARVRAEIASE
ncbi:PLxRFG domain-containing protein [Variovorax sp. 38R]|uniref:PLxRFG domain-containing protein n=1 Tax=Variovorax sp. 38R TaxID=2774875 RepID=UPI0017816D48|nr:PLxRFG domain-containing protein [Variovorax sp. 38R]QOF76060.1 PLxRFG domain-containing protein [Variovorax sp. 38R]